MGKRSLTQPVFMHPVIFIPSVVLLGILFALQYWTSLRFWNYHIEFVHVLAAWVLEYFFWGVICWLLWRFWGNWLQRAPLAKVIACMVPLSIALSVFEEMIWTPFFPNVPIGSPHMDYWHRLAFELEGEFFDNVVIIWCAFGLFRAIGYYQQFRQKESAAAQLEVQLANAQLSALRMQLNPHFLFNTMNSISSLMRSDIEAADTMLEQLGNLLRITLERGESQLIPLRDEIEFIEMYMALQERRYGDRVQQSVTVAPELHDAIVPAMILQPIVENAYAHGLSKLDSGGLLVIDVRGQGDRVVMSVLNSGVGILAGRSARLEGSGVGLANTKARLALHYGSDQSMAIRQSGSRNVEVVISIPLRLSQAPLEQISRFGR